MIYWKPPNIMFAVLGFGRTEEDNSLVRQPVGYFNANARQNIQRTVFSLTFTSIEAQYWMCRALQGSNHTLTGGYWMNLLTFTINLTAWLFYMTRRHFYTPLAAKFVSVYGALLQNYKNKNNSYLTDWRVFGDCGIKFCDLERFIWYLPVGSYSIFAGFQYVSWHQKALNLSKAHGIQKYKAMYFLDWNSVECISACRTIWNFLLSPKFSIYMLLYILDSEKCLLQKHQVNILRVAGYNVSATMFSHLRGV